ncbi:MAG TPA: 6,7-dimethyl-8-ribityllumazine synthase, partial [Acidimicrobiales bacterium]|nr:6,7-dimethyl-8-ribityllumazine synthase [Acidimicrobiales bacterium]
MATDDALMISFGDIAAGTFSTSEATVVWGDPLGQGINCRVGIACARFNGDITMRLLDGAKEALDKCGVPSENITVVWVPGAFELPLAARYLAWTGAYDAVVCLGAVIRGDTGHYEFVATEAASGIQRVALDTGIPVAFGVLTTENRDQADQRAGGSMGNKGYEAAISALETADVLRGLAEVNDD